jgi:hypothetical protein
VDGLGPSRGADWKRNERTAPAEKAKEVEQGFQKPGISYSVHTDSADADVSRGSVNHS